MVRCSGFTVPLSINIAQKPCIVGSLDAKALKYESFEGKGFGFRMQWSMSMSVQSVG